MARSLQKKFEMTGWVLFTFSAVFFLLSSLKSGDIASLLGSLLFLVACVVFMWPLVGSSTRHETSLPAGTDGDPGSLNP